MLVHAVVAYGLLASLAAAIEEDASSVRKGKKEGPTRRIQLAREESLSLRHSNTAYPEGGLAEFAENEMEVRTIDRYRYMKQNQLKQNQSKPQGDLKQDLLLVFGLSAAAGLAVVLFIKVGDFLGWVFADSGEESKLQELAAQQETARAIEEALESAKAAAAKKAAREAAATEAAARGEEAAAPIEIEEAEEPVFSNDELVGSMLVSSHDGQKQVANLAETIKNQTDWAVKRADLAKSFFDNEQKSIKGRTEDFAIREVTNLMHKLDVAMQAEGQASIADTYGGLTAAAEGLHGAVGASSSAVEKVRGLDRVRMFFTGDSGAEDVKKRLLDEIRPNPFSTLLVGAIAPTQLQWMLSSSQFSIIYSGVVLATALAILVLHAATACDERFVWTWLFVLIGTNATMVVISAIYRTWCSSALEIIRAQQAKVNDVVVDTGNPLLDTFSRIQNGVSVFVKAASLYNGIVLSRFYSLKQLAFFLNTINGSFGLVITIWKVKEHESCAKPLVLFLNIYSLIFLICLSFTLVSFSLWLVSVSARTRAVNDALLNLAMSLDKGLPGKLPLFSTLARAFLLTDSMQILDMKSAEAKADVRKLEESVNSVHRKLAEANALREDAENHRIAAEVMEAAMIEKYNAKLATLPPGTTPTAKRASQSSGGTALLSSSP
jgi:hypothetical protein